MDIVKQLVQNRPDFFQNRFAYLDRVIKINDFISMSVGLSNAYMVTTAAGRVIINTGMGFEALTHKKIFDAEYAGSTPYIVLTQGHVDHVGGVSHFREPGTQLIAQSNLKTVNATISALNRCASPRRIFGFAQCSIQWLAMPAHRCRNLCRICRPPISVSTIPTVRIGRHALRIIGDARR